MSLFFIDRRSVIDYAVVDDSGIICVLSCSKNAFATELKQLMTNLRDVLPKIKDLEPSADRILWRYMDIPSLIEILQFGSLPLVKISNLVTNLKEHF